MESVGELAKYKKEELDNRLETIKVTGKDPMSKRGFTQVPNFILENPDLSTGAKLTYAMFLRYAWSENHCYPGHKRLAKDIGVAPRSIVRYTKELEEKGYITIKRRGFGQVNFYTLHQTVRKKK